MTPGGTRGYDASFWEKSEITRGEDERAFREFFSWLLVPSGEGDDLLPEELGRRLYHAMARVDRFRFRHIGVPNLALFEGGLFRWFRSFEDESDRLVQSLAAHRGWSEEAARRYLFSLEPPFVRSGIRVPARVERYYGLAAAEFIHGHAEACVALCRAALEGMVKAHLGYRGGATFSLGEAIDRLMRQRVLAGPSLDHASDINREANRVLHKLGEAEGRTALAVFASLRSFIQSYYGFVRKGRNNRGKRHTPSSGAVSSRITPTPTD